MNKPRMMQHPVGDAHKILLGDMVASFALLEAELKGLVSHLLGSDISVARIVTAELSFGALKALMVSLYLNRFGNDGLFAELRQLLSEAVKVENLRNTYTHSQWAAGPDAQTIVRFKTTAKEKRGLNTQYEEVTTQDMQEFVDSIKILTWKFCDYTFLRTVGRRVEDM